jgi:hypothetical protein
VNWIERSQVRVQQRNFVMKVMVIGVLYYGISWPGDNVPWSLLEEKLIFSPYLNFRNYGFCLFRRHLSVVLLLIFNL